MSKEEAVTKAAQCADLLLSDVSEAHKIAAVDDPILALMLEELMIESQQLFMRLSQIDSCLH